MRAKNCVKCNCEGNNFVRLADGNLIILTFIEINTKKKK